MAYYALQAAKIEIERKKRCGFLFHSECGIVRNPQFAALGLEHNLLVDEVVRSDVILEIVQEDKAAIVVRTDCEAKLVDIGRLIVALSGNTVVIGASSEPKSLRK